jgi:hypothetical protein
MYCGSQPLGYIYHGQTMEASLPRPSEATSFPLLALADELILSIIEQIDSREDLNSLATTCSRLQDLTEPYIWR